MTTRVAFQTAMRAAAVTLFTDFAATRPNKSQQVYAGRPRSLFPPTTFVDKISERIVYLGPTNRQRQITVEAVVVHGIFDSADTVAQRDEFIDSFLDFVTDRYHAAGPNTVIAGVSTDDDPNWIPDWLPVDKQQQYYATVISLEGLAQD